MFHPLTAIFNHECLPQGGGWCVGLEDCYNRSTTTLGSSTTYPATAELIGSGYFSNESAVNPQACLLAFCHVSYSVTPSLLADVQLEHGGRCRWFLVGSASCCSVDLVWRRSS